MWHKQAEKLDLELEAGRNQFDLQTKKNTKYIALWGQRRGGNRYQAFNTAGIPVMAKRKMDSVTTGWVPAISSKVH